MAEYLTILHTLANSLNKRHRYNLLKLFIVGNFENTLCKNVEIFQIPLKDYPNKNVTPFSVAPSKLINLCFDI